MSLQHEGVLVDLKLLRESILLDNTATDRDFLATICTRIIESSGGCMVSSREIAIECLT